MRVYGYEGQGPGGQLTGAGVEWGWVRGYNKRVHEWVGKRVGGGVRVGECKEAFTTGAIV